MWNTIEYATAMHQPIDALEAIVVGSVAVTARALQRAGTELTLVQWRALVVLREAGRPLAIGSVADGLGSSASATSRQLSRLAVRGLVAGRRSHEDRRTRLVELTASGRALVERVVAERDRELASLAVRPGDVRAVERLATAFTRLANTNDE